MTTVRISLTIHEADGLRDSLINEMQSCDVASQSEEYSEVERLGYGVKSEQLRKRIASISKAIVKAEGRET